MRYTLLILFWLLPSLLLAQHKNFSITPAPAWLIPQQPDLNKKPDNRDISDGYYLLLLEEQQNLELHARYQHRIRQIISEAGIQNGAEISVSYDPAYQKLHFHQVIIRRNGEVINKLQADRFKFLQQEDELSRFIYSGLYNAYLILEDVRKGDQIEYAYTLEGNNPVFGGKFSEFYNQSFSTPIVNVYENIICNPSRDIQFKAFNGAKMPITKTYNGMKVFEWTHTNLKPSEEKKSVPSWYSATPYVHASEYKSWKEVIDWGCNLNAVTATGPALKAKIAELKKETGDNRELYIQKAIRFVQDDIRYMGIEMGEYSHRPNTPDKVLAQRFGDCKDKSLLLVTLLNANDIPASMAYVNTYDKNTVSDNLPAPDLFNHAIVYTTFNNKPLWIDPTTSYQRGTVSNLTIPDYGKGLVIRPGNIGFERIANAGQSNIRVTEEFSLPNKDEKKGLLKVTTIYTGECADDIRNTFASESLKEEEQAYRDYYKRSYGKLSVDSAMSIKDNDSLNRIETVESYLLDKTWKRDSANEGRVTFKVYADILLHELPAYADKESRDAPLRQRFPKRLDYNIVLNMPENWSFEEPEVHIKNAYYQFDFKAITNGARVTLHYHYETFQDNIPVAFMSNYITDRDKIDDVLNYYFYWTNPGETDTNNKKDNVKPAPRSFNWMMIGLALLAGGFFWWQASIYYKKSLLPIKEPLERLPINSWLILIAIGTIIRPISILVQLIDTQIFTNEFWYSLNTMHNVTGNVSVLQLLVSAELLFNVFFIVVSVLLMVLFFKRRDSFPQTMIFYLLLNMLFVIVDVVIWYVITARFLDNESISLLWRTFMAGAIWTPYLMRSEQVKETFIMPYDENL